MGAVRREAQAGIKRRMFLIPETQQWKLTKSLHMPPTMGGMYYGLDAKGSFRGEAYKSSKNK